jgi:hypothetical protein
LPIVVVIGSLSVVGLAAWQRSDVIADLADRVARGERAEATAAVRQLAAIPKPPLAILVGASASDERATAEAAQVAINRMLGQWQKQVDKKQRVGSVAAQVTELAAALAAQREAFRPADYPWLAGAARKILRIANQCPAKKTPLVALHCDEIFSVAERSGTATKVASGAEESGGQQRIVDGAVGRDPAHAETRQEQLEREFLMFPTPPIVGDEWPSGEISPEDVLMPSGPGPRDTEAPFDNLSPFGTGHDRPAPPLTPIPIGRQWSPADGAVRPDWSLPIFRIVPTIPVDINVGVDSRAKGGQAFSAPTNRHDHRGDGARPVRDNAAAETRALLDQWYDASEYQRPGIEEKLAERGFRRLSTRVVKQYLSDDMQERLSVVDSVLTEPDVDPRSWLLLLAEDEDPDVRLMAVSVMATSNDQQLIEVAWQTAIGDQDPRIADLAERLRARRR